ncbi:hypothetical protein N7452_011266 [Penicillium brevicompactum]|uniref:Uncharacterized protein n=1 Tax=Penicillium brevicompactum TaxID=5074 RepID=A0A9W9Q417_PENBR|nr:hypothetical protein N7452_011266 [Penicillium brevicompactum]
MTLAPACLGSIGLLEVPLGRGRSGRGLDVDAQDGVVGRWSLAAGRWSLVAGPCLLLAIPSPASGVLFARVSFSQD